MENMTAGPVGVMDESASSCGIRTEQSSDSAVSRILRYDGTGWDGVRMEPYKRDGASFRGITRRVLSAADPASFDVRYFEIEPGGHSTHERHSHIHVVVCMRGTGRVRLDGDTHDVGFGDTVYVAPDDPHQFLNPNDEPFGFLCIVNRERAESEAEQ